MQPLPEHGACFVCGAQNPHSIGIRWYVKEEGTIYGKVTLNEAQQGPPSLAHGGATTALLDEAMGAAIWYAGLRVAAVNLNVDFLRPVPLGTEIEVTGWMVNKEQKVVRAEGEVRLPDGEIAVSARGTFVEAPQLFDH
jgi:uncharacterized protein (TIGR00369 family)